MRFTMSDWLRLILACIAASAAVAVASGASWSALGFNTSIFHGRHPLGLPGARNILFAITLALGVLQVPLIALVAWPVLRSCVNGLRLAPWLAETALGAALGGIVSVPAMVLLLSGSVPPSLNSPPIGWLPPVAAGVAALLPPGLLLQRLGGVRAWPSALALVVVAGAMTAPPAVLGRAVVHEMVPQAMLVVTTILPMRIWGGVAAVAVVLSGVLWGFILGSGLFLMARLSRSTMGESRS